MMTLQQDFDDTTIRMRVRAPIVATPVLLKITLYLRFRLDQRDNLVTGLHHSLPEAKHVSRHEDTEVPHGPTSGHRGNGK